MENTLKNGFCEMSEDELQSLDGGSTTIGVVIAIAVVAVVILVAVPIVYRAVKK